MPETISAVVVAYNRAPIIGTCLRALRFADEVIVVDKSSTDATPDIASRHADRVITVPWTPAVEDTRTFAVAQCAGDWVLCLDDDECLDPAAAIAIRAELAAPRADIYSLPLKHYILGVHDPDAYYWPEHHPRLFRRGAVTFSPTVHGGIQLCSGRVLALPPESGAVIHHLSHRDVRDWLDKCNRYTARPDRVRPEHAGLDLVAFAHARVDHWQERSRDRTPGGYPSAAALLRALYDIVDRLKTWEEERGLDGAASFAATCQALDAAYEARPDVRRAAAIRSEASPEPVPVEATAVLRARTTELRARCDALAAAAASQAAEAAAHLAEELAHLAEELAQRDAALAAAQQSLRLANERLAAIEASTCWRATEGARRLADRARRLARAGRRS